MKKDLGHEAIYDARQLGTPRMLVLGLQHMFAMFGATVLVPILVQGYGLPLSIQTTLLFAGLGTLLFHVCTKFKVPAFLGSSFAYLGGFSTVATMPAYEGLDPETKLAYALGGIVIAGLLYLVLALGMPQLKAQGINLLFFIPCAALSSIVYSFKRLIDWKTVLLFAAGGLPGVLLGSLAIGHMGSGIPGKIFGGFLLLTGIRELFKKCD